MSVCIHIKDKVVQEIKCQEEIVPTSIVSVDGSTFVFGEVFDCTIEEVAKNGWETNPSKINEPLGALSMIKITEENCYASVDADGINSLYYYHADDEFIVSTNIWDIIKILKPCIDDVDGQWIRQSIISTCSNSSTFVKNVHIVFPNTHITYNIIHNTIEIKKIGDFRYSREVKNVDDAVNAIDKILNNTFGLIRSRFDQKTKYGIGISGGLDSRIIPHYALLAGMDLVGFNICTLRPNHLFLANSCINASKIAKIFRIPFYLVEWKSDSIKQKIELKNKNYPLGSGRNSFKYESQGMPNFDVLLTGGTGLIVGSELPTNIDIMSDKELRDSMKNKFIHMRSSSSLSDRMNTAISYIFKSQTKTKKIDPIILKVFNHEIDVTMDEIDKYIDEMRNNGHDNVEIFENFFLNVLGFRNRNGSFESLLGTKRSYSIYIPFILPEVMKWDSSLLINRKVLNQLIVEKIPEVSSVSTETYHGKPGENNPRFINKLTSVITRTLRGNGTAIDENNINSKFIKQEMNDTFNNGNSWFYRFISKEDAFMIMKRTNDPAIKINLWEMKMLIDLLEKMEYLAY